MSYISETERVVCVTGASGFIASWLVKLLLDRGYTVRATVRNLNDPLKTQHLLSLDGAKERLQLFRAELTEEGSFDSAIDGCECVFHTASPVNLSQHVLNPQTELLDPAVKGTLNVLRSCAKVSSIKRVVLTSSISAVLHNGKPLTSDVVVDETWFSDPVFCKKSKFWYRLSKTLAEKEAREFARKYGIDLVTIHPGLVIGPILQPTVNLTVSIILDLINGAKTYHNSSYRYVDVRDVATAHILGFENHSASGSRFCLVNKVAHSSDVLVILRSLYPSLPLPDKVGDDSYFGSKMYSVSKEKAEELGVCFTPLEVSVRDTVESLKEKGFFKPKETHA